MDGHCHLGPHAGFFLPASEAAGLVQTMDRIGVDRACVFPTLGVMLDARAGNAAALAPARAVDLAGDGKLLYGSDAPWMCASYQIGRVLLAPIAEASRRRILGETLAGLLATRRG